MFMFITVSHSQHEHEYVYNFYLVERITHVKLSDSI